MSTPILTHAKPAAHNSTTRQIRRALQRLSDTMLYDIWVGIEQGYTEEDKTFSAALVDELISRRVLIRKPNGMIELT